MGLINPLDFGFLALSDSALAAARKEEVWATKEGSAVARLLNRCCFTSVDAFYPGDDKGRYAKILALTSHPHFCKPPYFKIFWLVNLVH